MDEKIKFPKLEIGEEIFPYFFLKSHSSKRKTNQLVLNIVENSWRR